MWYLKSRPEQDGKRFFLGVVIVGVVNFGALGVLYAFALSLWVTSTLGLLGVPSPAPKSEDAPDTMFAPLSTVGLGVVFTIPPSLVWLTPVRWLLSYASCANCAMVFAMLPPPSLQQDDLHSDGLWPLQFRRPTAAHECAGDCFRPFSIPGRTSGPRSCRPEL